VDRPSAIPLGPDRKDPPWRWGSFFIGLASFAVLAWLATLGDINLLGWWWFVSVVLGVLFSLRYGTAWRRGEVPSELRRVRQPTVDVRGQAGSTYVLLESPKGGGRRGVRPREFSPGWWALYSIVVRAPVNLGDLVLTLGWRAFGGFRNGGTSALAHELEDGVDYAEDFPRPDADRF
jgi:hypothetical protein